MKWCFVKSKKLAYAGLGLCLAWLLSACGSAPMAPAKSEQAKSTPKPTTNAASVKTVNHVASSPALPKANSGRGGYYQDDGPGDAIPADLESTVDPIPVVVAYSRTGNKPYAVFGKTYTPIVDTITPFKQRGIASWYGKKFHGKRTSSGEPYDMYQITAAHPILPIPSYARVTNLSNGKQIIVRINDRGPFHSSRIMDLSYTAALKLGYLGKGSSEVELERLLPEDIAKMAENRANQIAVTPVSTADSKAAVEKERPALDNLIAAQERKLQADTAATNQAYPAASSAPVVGAVPSNTMNANPALTESGGSAFYLQFAAFAIRANADASMRQLQQQLQHQLKQPSPDQSAARDWQFEIVQQGSLYRLQGGPFATREAATLAAQQLALGGAKPIIISR